jgi:hypothetical protein
MPTSTSRCMLPLYSVIFRAASTQDLHSSSPQTQTQDGSSFNLNHNYNYKFARTDTALLPLRDEPSRLHNHEEEEDEITALPPAPAPQPSHQHTATAQHQAKKSAWNRIAERLKASFRGMKIRSKKADAVDEGKKFEISGPTDFKHVGGPEVLVATRDDRSEVV